MHCAAPGVGAVSTAVLGSLRGRRSSRGPGEGGGVRGVGQRTCTRYVLRVPVLYVYNEPHSLTLTVQPQLGIVVPSHVPVSSLYVTGIVTYPPLCPHCRLCWCRADVERELRSIKKCLLASGLLQRQGHTAYRMHRLVQASVISRVVAPVAEDTGDGGCHADSGDVERAARGIRSAWQTVYDKNNTSTWLAADLLVPHVQCLFDRCVGHGGQLSADTVCAIVDERLLQSCTWHITWNRHSLHSAATMLRNCDNVLASAVGLSDGEKVLGSARVQYGLGDVQYLGAHYDAAFEHYSKALAMRQSVLDENHPDIGRCHTNMGVVYRKKSDYKAALEQYTKALGIYRSTLDENHPDIAMCNANIGEVHAKKSDYKLAIQYYNKALTSFRSTFDESHPYIVKTSKNLAIARQRLAQSSS